MLKKTLIAIISLAFLASCTPKEDGIRYDFKDPKNELPNVETNITINQILLDEDKIAFDLYQDRPDLKLKEKDYQKDMALTVDLPIGLQPRLMYATEVNEPAFDMGTMCDRPRFPHRCEITLEKGTAEKSHKYFIRTVFEDETYAEKIIDIPFPEKLASPEILTPKAKPAQNSKLKMSFKDIGADNYEVRIELCKPYGNDGINPCLDGETYFIEKQNGELKLTENTSVYSPKLSIEKDIVTLESSLGLSFEESIGYSVLAHKKGVVGDKIPTYLTSYSSASFTK